MLPQKNSKIVYLFGAGATHAELINSYPTEIAEAKFLAENGLLMADVSRRVCKQAKTNGSFSKKMQNLLSSAGLSNVELFIGLVKSNQIKSERAISSLEQLIKNDITSRLSQTLRKKFYLHRALLELHVNTTSEDLLGLISLNYDAVLDDAYRDIYQAEPNFCLSSQILNGIPQIPLLKLHGGFDLQYRKHNLPILTPGTNKNYLQLPYSFIWGRALEILIDCDVLRIIGCSVSQNDVGLIDLLFKAHLEKGKAFEIQIISFDPKDNKIKEQYGFLPRITRATEIEDGIISDPNIMDPNTGSNPFKIWLKAKMEKMEVTRKISDIPKTNYLKKLLK